MNRSLLFKLLPLVIICIGLFPRLYKINLPLLDAKPHREIHTAEVTRNLYLDNFNVLYTKTKLWADEPGYYLCEFPIYNVLAAIPYVIFGTINEVWGKLISVFSSIGLAIFFFLLIRKYFNNTVAVWALIFAYLISPQEIILSRSYQPDQFGLFLGMGSLYFFSCWISYRKISDYFYSIILFMLTLLVKVQFFHFGVPMIYLAYEKFGKNFVKNKFIILYCISGIPILLWLTHIKSVYLLYPNLQSAFVLNANYWIALDKIFNLNWYINIFYDFIEQVITLPVFMLALTAFFIKTKVKFNFIFSWLFGLLIFVFLFSRNINYWYYQVPILFPLTVLAGITVDYLSTYLKNTIKLRKFYTIVIIITLMIFTGKPYLLRTYASSLNHKYVLETANNVKNIAKSNSKIITSSYNNASLTYYSLRPDMWGATFDINEPSCTNSCAIDKFENLIKWGASLYVVSDESEFLQNPEFLN